MITKTCKLKLYLIEDNKELREEKYNLLSNMAREARIVRNDTIKRCVFFNYINNMPDMVVDLYGPRKVHSKQKSYYHTYSTFLTSTKPEVKYLTETQVSELQTAVEKKFKNEISKYTRCERAYPIFKDYSLIIKSKNSEIKLIDNKYEFYPVILRNKGFVFGFTNIEKDKSIKTIVDRILDSTYKMGDSKIAKNDRDGFWYLFLTYNFNPDEKILDPEIVCGCDLGWVIPIYCGLKDGYNRASIGNSKEIQRFRTQIKNRRKNMQKNIHAISGHGYRRKLEALNSLSKKESNFAQTYNHRMSKEVIDFCIKNNAGTIHLEYLTKEVKKNSFLTEYWSYFQLQEMIQNKAKENGIIVRWVDPAYTSQTCPKCGHVSRENRPEQSKFRCVSCGWPNENNEEKKNNYINADYVASINISRSKGYSKNEIKEIIEEKNNEIKIKKKEAKKTKKSKKYGNNVVIAPFSQVSKYTSLEAVKLQSSDGRNSEIIGKMTEPTLSTDCAHELAQNTHMQQMRGERG